MAETLWRIWGAQALRQHYTRSRKGAATKREAAAETNRRLLEMYDELRETKQKGTECPKVSVSSIAEMMRRKGAFDEFGERPSKGACYRRILRLGERDRKKGQAPARRLTVATVCTHRMRHADGPGAGMSGWLTEKGVCPASRR